MANLAFKRLGNFLRKSRNSVKVTQTVVADKLGLQSSQFISNWERGKSAPPLHNIATLMEIYKINKDVLLRELMEVQKIQMQQQYEAREKELIKVLHKRR